MWIETLQATRPASGQVSKFLDPHQRHCPKDFAGLCRLLKLDVDALHELHYQMITLGKVCSTL
jgi:hypothetical protein